MIASGGGDLLAPPASPRRSREGSVREPAASDAGEVVERGGYAALLERDAGEREAHLDTGERARQHEVVEVAEVADPERLALQLAEAGAERHVEALEDGLPQRVRVVAGGREHRRDRVAVLLGVCADELEPPRAHRAPGRLAVA